MGQPAPRDALAQVTTAEDETRHFKT
jgi:hypothetical protein